MLSLYKQEKYPFAVNPLPYQPNALEPTIDQKTVAIHHDKHHLGYVTKLNTILENYPDFHDHSIDEILGHSDQLPEEIRQAVLNTGGGHANHMLYWEVMGPQKTTPPQAKLLDKILQTYKELEVLIEEVSNLALAQFGSGWAWLSVNPTTKELEISNTANQATPLNHNRIPILAIDVWEHAYYLNYQNKRDDYVQAWWDLVNWEKVSQLYLEAIDQ